MNKLRITLTQNFIFQHISITLLLNSMGVNLDHTYCQKVDFVFEKTVLRKSI